MVSKRLAEASRIVAAIFFATLVITVLVSSVPASACSIDEECPSLQACINGTCTAVECRTKWDCGAEDYVGEDYCFDDETIARDYKTYTCNSVNHTCNYTIVPKTQETCWGGRTCDDGECTFESLHIKMWADEEDVPFNDFVRIRGRVFAEDEDVPVHLATVKVSSDFDAHMWETKTNEDGEFSLAFMPPVGVHEFEAYAQAEGVTSSDKTVEVNVYEEMAATGGMDIIASVTPRSVKLGGIIEVSGKVTYQNYPIDAEIEMTLGNTVYTTTTGTFGSFSKQIVVRDSNVSRLRIDAYATTSGIDVNPQQLHAWQNITLAVSKSQKAIESLTLTAPESVKPGDTFEAYGTWTLDGEKVNGVDLVMNFAGETLIVPADGGSFSQLLTAPNGEGCFELSAGSESRNVCVRAHDSITVDIALEEETAGRNNVLITARYNDDGSNVSGTLIYDIGASIHARTKITNGLAFVEHEFTEGEHTISAYVSDGPRGKYHQEVFVITAAEDETGSHSTTANANQSTGKNATPITVSVGDVIVKKSEANSTRVPILISGPAGTKLTSLNVSLNDGAGMLIMSEEGLKATLPATFNFTVSGLEAGKTYNFCASAANSTGKAVLNYECAKFQAKSSAKFTLTHVLIGVGIAVVLLLLL